MHSHCSLQAFIKVNSNKDRNCYCGSLKSFKNCCKDFLERTSYPSTAEQLMRSRYSAYCRKEVDYIFDTHDPESRKDSYADIEQWANSVEWVRLEILSANKGLDFDHLGTVHFKAYYIQNDKEQILEEKSNFRKEGEQWLYIEGIHNFPAESSTVKIGRNDPCVCGSGKKYKKCCG